MDASSAICTSDGSDISAGKFGAVEGVGNIPAKTDTPEPSSRFRTDGELEAAISIAHAKVITAISAAECRVACRELESLVAQRSISQVRFMERVRGIG